MRTVDYYRTVTGKCPVQEFLDELSDKQVEKVFWVLKVIKELDRVPTSYFEKLKNTDDIWEVRVGFGGNIFRISGFLAGNSLVLLTNGFHKKTQKTPQTEIEIATERKKDYQNRRKNYG